MEEHHLSERRACTLMNISRTLFRYQTKPDANVALMRRLQELAREWPRAGHPKLHALIQREGMIVNHKRTERLYSLLKLSLRQKRRKRKRCGLRLVLPAATARHERWSMDFMSDSLASGRPFRVLTIVDQFTRECPWIEVNRSLTSSSVGNGPRIPCVKLWSSKSDYRRQWTRIHE